MRAWIAYNGDHCYHEQEKGQGNSIPWMNGGELAKDLADGCLCSIEWSAVEVPEAAQQSSPHALCHLLRRLHGAGRAESKGGNPMVTGLGTNTRQKRSEGMNNEDNISRANKKK